PASEMNSNAWLAERTASVDVSRESGTVRAGSTEGALQPMESMSAAPPAGAGCAPPHRAGGARRVAGAATGASRSDGRPVRSPRGLEGVVGELVALGRAP